MKYKKCTIKFNFPSRIFWIFQQFPNRAFNLLHWMARVISLPLLTSLLLSKIHLLLISLPVIVKPPAQVLRQDNNIAHQDSFNNSNRFNKVLNWINSVQFLLDFLHPLKEAIVRYNLRIWITGINLQIWIVHFKVKVASLII